MGFDVRVAPDSVKVDLTGWDALANLCRRVVVDVADIRCVSVERRADLEALVDHRKLGVGTHTGAVRPNRRRVGTMMGRGVLGTQFWAEPSSEGSHSLLVVDLTSESDFQRLVLAVDDPDEVAAQIAARRAVEG